MITNKIVVIQQQSQNTTVIITTQHHHHHQHNNKTKYNANIIVKQRTTTNLITNKMMVMLFLTQPSDTNGYDMNVYAYVIPTCVRIHIFNMQAKMYIPPLICSYLYSYLLAYKFMSQPFICINKCNPRIHTHKQR